MKSKHPYEEFENSELWNIIEKALNDLVENQDIALNTRKEYVIGFFCKNIQYNKRTGRSKQ